MIENNLTLTLQETEVFELNRKLKLFFSSELSDIRLFKKVHLHVP